MSGRNSLLRRLPLTLPLALLIVGAAVWAGCGEPQLPLEAEVEDFQVVREPNGTQYVRGVVHNPSERPLRAAQISVDLYDGDGEEGAAPSESMRVEVRDIAPGERKAFRQEVDTGLTLRGARVRNVLLF